MTIQWSKLIRHSGLGSIIPGASAGGAILAATRGSMPAATDIFFSSTCSNTLQRRSFRSARGQARRRGRAQRRAGGNRGSWVGIHGRRSIRCATPQTSRPLDPLLPTRSLLYSLYEHSSSGPRTYAPAHAALVGTFALAGNLSNPLLMRFDRSAVPLRVHWRRPLRAPSRSRCSIRGALRADANVPHNGGENGKRKCVLGQTLTAKERRGGRGGRGREREEEEEEEEEDEEEEE